MTSLITFAIILLLPIVFIGIGYYFDYRQNKNDFVKTLKNIGIGFFSIAIATVLISLVFNTIVDLFPWNNNYGKNYNKVRESEGIPLIEKTWGLTKFSGSKFEQWWMDSVNTDNNIHTTKIIEFDMLGPTNELDYFSSEIVNYRLESNYSYNNKSFSYRKIFRLKNKTFSHLGYTSPLPDENTIVLTKKEFKILLAKMQSTK